MHPWKPLIFVDSRLGNSSHLSKVSWSLLNDFSDDTWEFEAKRRIPYATGLVADSPLGMVRRTHLGPFCKKIWVPMLASSCHCHLSKTQISIGTEKLAKLVAPKRRTFFTFCQNQLLQRAPCYPASRIYINILKKKTTHCSLRWCACVIIGANNSFT